MAEYILTKRYVNHAGLDLKSSDLNRPIEFASGIKNTQYRKSGAIEKRLGFEAFSSSQGGHGLFTYNRVNPTTQVQEAIVLSVSNKLHRLRESTLTVTYTGATSADISITYSTSAGQYVCEVTEGASTVLTKNLGLGFDEASTVTIDQLRSDIDALANFSATVSGATTTPAAFIRIIRNHDLVVEPLSISAGYWENVNAPIANHFAGSETNKNSDDFENVSAVQTNNVMLITNGYDAVQKFDGQNVYNAGVPVVTHVGFTLSAGAITGTNYKYVYQVIQKDAVGNFVEGNYRESTLIAALAAQQVEIETTNVAASSGYNTNCAIVNGAQITVNTITVDDGSGGSHTMKVGDTAYFYDSVSAAYIEREVTAVAATTITVAGAAVTVSDNAVISNNLRIAVYRSKTSGSTPSTFYLVGEFPNKSFGTSQVFQDNLTDAQLGAQFIEPLTDRSAPPKGKYISLFRNITIIAGNPEAPNTVFYSDVDGPEYFPSGVTEFNLETVAGDTITGLSPNNELFAVFKKQAVFEITGDITNNNIRVNQITNDIGCSAHHSIQEVRGTLCFLSDRGPYQMRGGEIPQPIGDNRLEPMFDNGLLTEELKSFLFPGQSYGEEQRFRLKRAVAINDRAKEKYMLYIPTESEDGSSNKYANTSSYLLVFDYSRGAWLLWNNMNMAGGITIANDELYFSERRLSSYTTTVDHILYRRHTLADAHSYQDNNSPVPGLYETQWEALGAPSVLKRFLRLNVFNLEETLNNESSLEIETEADYVRDVAKASFSLDVGGFGYGQSLYGEDAYGDPLTPSVKHRLSLGRFRALRVRFINEEPQENFVISGYDLEIAAPFRQALKS